MASEAVANGSTATEGLTPAQQLMEQHDHHVTVEDVPDEDELAAPPASTAAKSDAADATAAAPLSAKAAGKQKVTEAAPPAKKNVLDTSSEENFPALGPAKPRAAPAASSWGKKPASLAPNGANGTGNGTGPTSRASTPASGAGTPLQTGRGPGAGVSLPGKYTERISFHPTQITPRPQLKKPIPDIIRDINRRSKAKVEYKSGGANGMVIFEAIGPQDAVRQSLQEVANEVGKKVRPFFLLAIAQCRCACLLHFWQPHLTD
jgi:hypothetical protein